MSHKEMCFNWVENEMTEHAWETDNGCWWYEPWRELPILFGSEQEVEEFLWGLAMHQDLYELTGCPVRP